jgi:hypothetical protein
MRIAALVLLGLPLLAAPAASQSAGDPFTIVENGRGYGNLQEAVHAIGDGEGTIRIAPGRYRTCAVQEAGRIAFVAAEPGTVVFERETCEGKAALVLRGRAARVEGLVFRDLEVADGNGAGIRLEQGDLTVVNAMFLDSQSGILTANGQPGTITVDHSTFAGLGKDPTGNGAHGIYVGDYGQLIVTRSRFERGTGGHYLKSRATRIRIVDNSFDDMQGSHTNYMIDLSNGASGLIAGNSFAVGPNKDNYSTMITVAPEGQGNSSAGLVVERNRAWLGKGVDFRTTFVGNWSSDRVTVRGNELGEGITDLARR